MQKLNSMVDVMKNYILCFGIAVFLGCRPSFTDKVVRDTVSLGDDQARPYTAELFTAKLKKPEAAIILLYQSEMERQVWRETATALAMQNYLVLSGPLPSENTKAEELSQLKAAWTWIKTNHPQFKVGIVGWERTALTCFKAGCVDSSLAAAVFITPTPEMGRLDSLQSMCWAGRALLMIVAEQDTVWPMAEAQRFYNALPDHKKLVQLVTDKRGGALLQSDMEPIVRRTMVLLFDRYLRGKN